MDKDRLLKALLSTLTVVAAGHILAILLIFFPFVLAKIILFSFVVYLFISFYKEG